MYENKYDFSHLLIGFSVLSVLFAALGASGYDIYLASTQWMLVATVFALWGIYMEMAKKK